MQPKIRVEPAYVFCSVCFDISPAVDRERELSYLLSLHYAHSVLLVLTAHTVHYDAVLEQN